MKQPALIEALVDAEDHEALNEMSQYCIPSFFRTLEFCDPVHGIFGAQPGDMLHMFQLGVVKTAVICFLECFTPKQKTLLDDMGRRFNKRLRQSQRKHFPRTDYSRGITNTKQKQAEEYTGLLFVFCALIQNHDAFEIVGEALDKHELEIVDVLQVFECLLCFDRWCRKSVYWTNENSTEEQNVAINATRAMMNMLMSSIPRNTGNGWALSKLHDILHVPMFITRFGNPMNYNTGFCEHNHKYQAKIPGRKAAKRHDTFTNLIAKNIVDSHVLQMYASLMEKNEAAIDTSRYDTLPEPEEGDDDDNDEPLRESTLRATQCHLSVADNVVKVKWTTRGAKKPVLSNGLTHFIVQHFGLQTDADKSVTLYTEYKRNDTLFRCHPDYCSLGPWYDWCMLMYVNNSQPDVVLLCPAQLMTIVCVDGVDPKKYHPILQ